MMGAKLRPVTAGPCRRLNFIIAWHGVLQKKKRISADAVHIERHSSGGRSIHCEEFVRQPAGRTDNLRGLREGHDPERRVDSLDTLRQLRTTPGKMFYS
jgi:hypothetical protein